MSEGNGYAGRDAFAIAKAPRFDAVLMPGVGTVRIRSLTSREHGEYEADLIGDDGRVAEENMPLIKSRLLVACIVDSEGTRVFADADDETVADWDSAIVDRLYDACVAHCGIDSVNLEEAAKNSEATTDDDSQLD